MGRPKGSKNKSPSALLATHFRLGLDPEQYRLPWGELRLPRDYRNQKMDAESRGVPFLLTFEEWLKIWVDSGHLYERGCRRGQYVMARFGDEGPYTAGNNA